MLKATFAYRRRSLCSVMGLLILAIFLSSACGGEQTELVIPLVEQGDSSQSGTATLTASGDQTLVVLRLNPGPPSNDPQPVHIHFGSCGPGLGSVNQGLTDLVDGQSTTTVEATLQSLQDSGNAINVHQSQSEIRAYTACGDISED